MVADNVAAKGKLFLAFTFLAGILLPVVAIIVELTTAMCADVFFDPLPSVWHTLLVCFVPLANLQLWLAVRKGRTEHGAWLAWANALSTGVALFYTLVYLALLPLALVAIIYFGMGLLPMAPLFALIAGLLFHFALRRIAPHGIYTRLTGFALGIGLALAAFTLLEARTTVTRLGMKWVMSESAERSARGLRWLRAVGDEETMRRFCYERRGMATDIIGFLLSLDEPVTTDEAREIYYRVTGEAFNSVPPPELTRSGERFLFDDFSFDADQGGTSVAGRVRGLTLSSSRIDGSIGADAALGYVEWTLNFKNDSPVQREARMQIELPPGGVVSRLTLWVNGEEREAAFAGRSQVREAYQQVAIRQRRDPVLVTTSGPDRVLTQCFPVPPNGGEMRIRLGITAPLALESREQAMFRLPHFVERNFTIPDAVKHSVWMESRTPLTGTSSDVFRFENPSQNVFAARAALDDEQLNTPSTLIRANRSSDVTEAWTIDPTSEGRRIVRETLTETTAPAPRRIVIVVDGSRRMSPFLPQIASALSALPPNIRADLIFASDETLHLGTLEADASTEARARVANELRGMVAEGGRDNVPALVRAWDAAAEGSSNAQQPGVIVWIHAAQPVMLSGTEELEQRWERRPEGVRLLAIEATEASGANRILENLDRVRAIETVPRLGDLTGDLERLFQTISGARRRIEFVRTSSEERGRNGSARRSGVETSAHLARLWARDEVLRLLSGENRNVEEATELAARYQLVTPVSGAVVLETQEQYRSAGLQPVDAGSVPTIPEPELVLLAVVVMLVAAWAFYQKAWRRRSA